MLNTPVADNPISPSERRRHVRLKVREMAYLDIGVDNGGIALNLSEEGMSVQAVAPLHGQTDINLRIQIPGSRTRIKTAARIVWRSESNRQVGVRFVEMPSEGRSQLRQWVRFQLAPNAPMEAAESQAEETVDAKVEAAAQGNSETALPIAPFGTMASEPEVKPAVKAQERVEAKAETKTEDATQSKPKPALEPRNYKWTKLMSKAVAEISAQQENLSRHKSEILENPAIAPSDQKEQVHALPEPEIAAQPIDEPVEALETVAPTVESRPQEVPVSIQPSASEPAVLPDVQQNLPGNGTGSHSLQGVDRAIAEWRAAASPAAPAQETERPKPSPSYAEPPAPAATPSQSPVSKTGKAATVPSPVPASRPAREWPAINNKWLVLGGLFALFSILSFSIGRWGAPQNARNESAQLPLPPVEAPTSLPNFSGNIAPEIAQPAPRENRKSRGQRDARESIRENQSRAQSLPSAPAADPPVQQVAPSASPVQSLPPQPEAKQAESNPAPVAVPAASPAPEEPSAPQAAPRIVDGRVLKLTDRFNPCYLTYRVEPEYPEEALRNRIEGTVKIHLNIAANGSVSSMKLLSGSPKLAPAAMEAAKYWQYLPALLNGQPVETGQDIEIEFHLPY